MTAALREAREKQPTPVMRDDFKVMDEFHRFKPTPFNGSPNPLDAEHWLLEMEKRIDFRVVEDHLRVKIAGYYLQDAAGHWWTVTKTRRNVEGLTWDEFEKIFLERYFHVAIKNSKINEFMELDMERSGMSVLEYDEKFEELSRHAPDMVKTEPMRALKYLKGLSPKMCSTLAPHLLTERTAIFERVLVVEAEKKNFQERMERKRNYISEKNDHAKSSRQGFPPKDDARDNRREFYNTKQCYECGDFGHIKRFCPRLVNQGCQKVQRTTQPNQQEGNAYAAVEAEINNVTVEGKI
ncbi:uncharacterized protein LOC113328529 [Papaver somniferum]|uniref:uncharacterized protein LOC113328529 n=1 Tax=Papaver somniferum TaxID=3469 RepID=UPI000E704B69|nr:uncharacterized protein LOC113328529 [Papaver somniferum]